MLDENTLLYKVVNVYNFKHFNLKKKVVPLTYLIWFIQNGV